VELSRNHSFLVAEGDFLEKTLTAFKQDKNALIKEFINRHYENCLEDAEKLKTDEGKRNRYAKDYKELTQYFNQLSPSLIAYINHQWQDKIIKTKPVKKE
ncbi:MAG: hypothetical protein R6U02_04925, partial [Alkalibacterium sp.]|uniref:hypothetical protein n=1 Tax=Alkalibacterium sp. TaxID=1872447 RepID=UPI003970D691